MRRTHKQHLGPRNHHDNAVVHEAIPPKHDEYGTPSPPGMTWKRRQTKRGSSHFFGSSLLVLLASGALVLLELSALSNAQWFTQQNPILLSNKS